MPTISFVGIVMRNKPLNRTLIALPLATVFASASCFAPESIEMHYDGAAQDEQYDFDILMLSEWAGHILPEKASVRLYADDKYYYRLDDVEMKANENGERVFFYNDSIIKDASQLDSSVRFSLDTLKASADKGHLTLHPFIFDENLEVLCDVTSLSEAVSAESKLGIFNTTFGLSVDEYQCTYTTSGALSLRHTWDILNSTSGHDHQIYVGNGDSFGVSQRASAMYNDLPTPELLSLIGLQIETFGNHNFDNKIDYLQKIIDLSNPAKSGNVLGYHYVATNLQNAPNLKNWLTHDTVTIPSSQAGHEGLKVAFIGALDTTVFATTKTGSFGSINIDGQMCSIVNEIELAYNENARAFFILGHILTGEESFGHLMDAIFTFTEPILSTSIKNDGKTSLNFLSQCDSKIVVPLERIESTFGVRTLSKLDFKDTATKEKYAHLIDEIRHEIFTEIIGVLGEAVDVPSVLAYYHEKSDLAKERKGIIWNAEASKAPNKLDYPAYNLLKNAPNTCQTDSPFDRHPCYNIPLSPKNTTNAYNHPIYYIQIPDKGVNTLSLKISATINKDIHNGDGVASTYDVNADTLQLLPVVSSRAAAQLDLEGTTIDLIEPEYHACAHFIEALSDRISDKEKSCLTFYQSIANEPQTYMSLSEMKSTEDGSNEGQTQQEAFESCHNAFSSYIFNANTSEEIAANSRVASGFWACLYTAASSLLCQNDKKDPFFLSPVVYEFKDYVSSTTPEDRSQSTYNSNIVSDGYFNYMKQQDPELDISIINAGTIRAGDMSQITTSLLPLVVPFDNKLVSASIQAHHIVNMLETALQKGFERQLADYGGFPSVARLAVAYERSQEEQPSEGEEISEPKTIIKVKEIWKTDQFGALIEPIYLSSLDEQYFAKYHQQGDQISVVFSPTSPWLCSQSTYTDCSSLTEGIEFTLERAEDGHYYSPNSYKILSHTYLSSGGDEYPNSFGLSSPDLISQYDISFRTAVYSYYSGHDTNMEQEVTLEDQCIERSDYTTFDKLTPEIMNCILYVNHLYETSTTEKSRWIVQTSESVGNQLKQMCTASELQAYL